MRYISICLLAQSKSNHGYLLSNYDLFERNRRGCVWGGVGVKLCVWPPWCRGKSGWLPGEECSGVMQRHESPLAPPSQSDWRVRREREREREGERERERGREREGERGSVSLSEGL